MTRKKWLITAIEAQRRLRASDDDRFWRREDAPKSRGRPSGKGRLARIHDVARDMGIAGSTLRNYLLALEALGTIPDLQTAEILSQHSAVAVAAFCRWANREPESAYGFIYDYPKASLAELLSAERAHRIHFQWRARRRPRPELDDALIARISAGPQFLAALGQHAAVHLGPGAVLFDIIPARYRFAGLDQLIVPNRDVDPKLMAPFTLAGTIRLPQLAILDDYGKRSKEIWWRAASASAYCPLVLVVFPGPAARRRFLAALPVSSDPANDSFAGLPQAPQAGTGSTYRPIYFRSGPGHGLIIMTSPLTLLSDLSE